MFTKIALGLLVVGMTTSMFAASSASDDASTYTSWTTGSTGGSGFSTWTISAPTNTAAFIGDSTTNGSATSGNINTSSKSFGLFANGATADATRSFTGGSLAVGDTFSLAFDNGNVQTGGTVGFGLQNSTGTNGFEFFFVGGASKYTVSGAADVLTSHGFTADGMTTSFSLTSSTAFSFSITFNTGTPTTETFTGSLKNGVTALDKFRLFNANAGDANVSGRQQNNAFFNSPSLTAVPEPSTLSLIGGPAILGAWMFIRRRRG
jgi:hypothetical protein